MNNIYEILKRLYSHLLFLVLLGISLSLYFNTTYYQKAQVSSLTRSLTGFWHLQASRFTDMFALRRTNLLLIQENTRLRNEIESYRVKLQAYDIASRQVTDTVGNFSYLPAKVIDNSINRRNNFIILDAGTRKGVYKGMGVICSNGVVGIVANANQSYSSVISLLNTNIKVSAMHKKSGSFGAISWDGRNYRRVILDEIPLHVDVAVGDTIITSGYSTIFPKGIPIGRVTDFFNKDGSFMEIAVELFADFKSIDYVYLVNSKAHGEVNQIQSLQQ